MRQVIGTEAREISPPTRYATELRILCAVVRGGSGEDFTNLVRYMEEQAGGVEVRSRRNAPKD